MKIGFDNKKYVKIQSKKIKERFKLFDKLYLEVGGKLFDDSHAARILPGFKNDVKISMFKELKDDAKLKIMKIAFEEEIIYDNDNDEIDNNNQQPETGINMTNNLVSFINEEPNNENSSENTLKKSQNSFISKKRRKKKTPNKTKEKENKNKKGKNFSHQDNSIKEAIKALLLIIEIIIEIFGNITLPNFDSNDFVGGTLQNEIVCR